MKRLSALLLSFVMFAGIMAGCGSSKSSSSSSSNAKSITQAASSAIATASSKNPGKKIKIGCTVYYMSEFITLMKKGVEDEAKAQNADLVFLDANNDVNKQISQIENLIAQKVDVLLVAAVDSDAIVPALDMAKKANIPLVGVNMLINTKEPYYYAGPNDVQAGELEAKYLTDKIGGKGNIVILDGPIGVSAQVQRKQGNHNIVDKLPGIKVLAEQPADWNREKALALMENWLESYKGKIDGVIAHNDEMALGAIQALQAKGLKDKIPVVGVDAIKDACISIKDGIQDMTVFQDAVQEGSLGVKIAAQVARGEKPDPMQQLIEMKTITKDNVDTLLSTIYKHM
jgi:ribose transport system substrate-binding protein/inositol transport system substrate-binding protein